MQDISEGEIPEDELQVLSTFLYNFFSLFIIKVCCE